MKKIFCLLALVLILGTVLRFYRLGEIPAGFHRDEAFLGYNAYSILKTGRDMNGSLLPLHLKSFLFSPAGYSYFSIPFIALFGLTEFSTRFTSAFFGSLTIIITYFLTKKLFRDTNRIVPLIASTMIAIVPWHINLSRTATENTIVVFFISLAVLLYLYWLDKNKWWQLLGSFTSFGITLLIYQAPRAFLPLFIPLMIITFLGTKVDNKRIFSLLLLYLFLILLPLFIILSSKDLALRIRTVSIFATQETQLVINDQILTDGVFGVQPVLARAFHNKIIMYTELFLKNYFKHFSYDFLFTDQIFPERYKIPLSGILYIFDLPFFILGLWYLLKNEKKVGIFLVSWLSLVPIGSGLTFDDIPNMQRTLIVFPALSIISAYGIFVLSSLLKTRRVILKSFSLLLIIFALSNLAFYLHQYYVHANIYRPWLRQNGYKQLVDNINRLKHDYRKVIITDRESAPTIFFLFYNKYDPSMFQRETKNARMQDFDRINFGKYEFSQEECPLTMIKDGSQIRLSGEKGLLYVNSGLCKESEEGVKTLNVVKRSDNSAAFRIVTIN